MAKPSASRINRESSTVSKIVHQDQYQSVPNERYQAPPSYPESPHEPPIPTLEAQTALDHYYQDSQRKGLSVTRAMLRKQAAIFAAKTWLEKSDQGAGAPAFSEDGSWGADFVNSPLSEGMSCAWSVPSIKNRHTAS